MADTQAELTLHLSGGIPVIGFEGEWHADTGSRLAEMVDALTQSGHYEIIVNLSRARRLPLPARDWLQRLERSAAFLRDHCGHLEMVGTVSQIAVCLRPQAFSSLRWSTSEEGAVSRLMGVPILTSGPKVRMRPMQQIAVRCVAEMGSIRSVTAP